MQVYKQLFAFASASAATINELPVSFNTLFKKSLCILLQVLYGE